ncbi:hypothetical protein IG616_18540 [Labrenzia suaedae]|uniref:Pentapeptide repeat protein n=2 Tax=Roseibium litorale TaxID=2803841 RepID=A0ABR9CRP4_9HYPH|nr:hypothetical protein [Roseibium litorale]
MLIRTFSDIQTLIEAGDLSEAEHTLIHNCKSGRLTKLGDGTCPDGPSEGRTIRAALLRYLILGGCEKCQVHEWGVKLEGAWISGLLDLSFASSRGATGLINCNFEHKVVALKTRFEFLNMTGTKLPGLYVQGIIVMGDVFLRRLINTGDVNLAGAEIGGQLIFTGAQLGSGDGRALNAQGVRVKSDLVLCDLKSKGEVRLAGAEIVGQLDFTGAELDGADGQALNAQRLTVAGGFVWRQIKSVKGRIAFNSAQLGGLVDSAASWEMVENLNLIGLTYENLIGPLDLRFRKSWLKKGAQFNGSFYPQPYQQLARFYRETGHRREAREILIEKEIQQRKAVRGRWRDELRFRRNLRKFLEHVNNKEPLQALNVSATKVAELSENWGELFKQRFGKSDWVQNRDPLVVSLLRQDFRNQLLWDNAKTVLRLLFHRSADRVYRYVTGYGYKPGRSLLVLAFLIACMTALAQVSWNMGDLTPNSDVIQISSEWQNLSRTEERPAEVWAKQYGRDYETFEPFFYAADVVIPIINIGQTDAWGPSTERSWWGWSMFGVQKLFVILGWVVTAIAAASVTNMIRRDD